MADIGSTLREARMRERIDISEVEAQTKIRAKYLRAIENEEWDLLPGPVYAKSFLRTYGDFLGLDSRMLIDEFKRRYERPSDQELRPATSIARERDRRRRGPRFPSWAPIAIVVVVILGVLYAVGSATQSGPSSSSARKPKVHHPRHHARPVHVPTVTKPTNVSLQLVPTGTVYVCLVNGSGAKLINERTFTTADKIPSATASSLLLTLGNASVRMTVNGKQVTVAPSPSAIRLLVTPTGVKHIPFSQTPTCP
ncbi:MAG TPA: helix-turn-helix transcriptional regulator [Solirubrobacteraceae bacterium]